MIRLHVMLANQLLEYAVAQVQEGLGPRDNGSWRWV